MILLLKKFTLIPLALSVFARKRVSKGMFYFRHPSIHPLRGTQDEREKDKFKTNKIKKEYLLLFLLSLHFPISGKQDPKLMLFDAADIGNNTKEITITFIVPEKDFIYKDFITCSVDEPTVTLSTWKTNKQSIEHYDPTFKETKQVFNETFSVFMTATTINTWSGEPIHLYCSYYRKADKRINHALFSFAFTQPLNTNVQVNNANIELHDETIQQKTQLSSSSIDQFYVILAKQTQHLTAFFTTHHKKCFSLLLIIVSIFFLFFHFYQELLRRHTKLYELIDVLLTCCTVLSIAYVLIYIYIKNTPFVQLITIGTSALFSAIIGFLYIRKSTLLQSGYLRTLCTFIGMLSVIGTFWLIFQSIQHLE